MATSGTTAPRPALEALESLEKSVALLEQRISGLATRLEPVRRLPATKPDTVELRQVAIEAVLAGSKVAVLARAIESRVARITETIHTVEDELEV